MHVIKNEFERWVSVRTGVNKFEELQKIAKKTSIYIVVLSKTTLIQ